jgi:hypothetical protein
MTEHLRTCTLVFLVQKKRLEMGPGSQCALLKKWKKNHLFEHSLSACQLVAFFYLYKLVQAPTSKLFAAHCPGAKAVIAVPASASLLKYE